MSGEGGSRTIQGVEAPASGNWEIAGRHPPYCALGRVLRVESGPVGEPSGRVLRDHRDRPGGVRGEPRPGSRRSRRRARTTSRTSSMGSTRS